MMLKIICSLFIFISLTTADLVNRTDTITWVDIIRSDVFRGIEVKKRVTGTEILWMEEIDAVTNTLKVHFNYIFEETGTREIINVENLCGNYAVGTLEHDVQLLILSKWANTDRCPIKKGTSTIYSVPDPYTYPTENRECGLVDGMIQLFKKSSGSNNVSPLYLRIYFRGNVTGPNCL